MEKILVIGHSHIAALQKAKTADEMFIFHSIANQQGMNNVSAINSNNYRSIIFSILGNKYHTLGLTNLPDPFDFYLPEKINLPLQTNARLLPVSLVSNALAYRMKSMFLITDELLKIFNKNNIYQLESPPPIRSEAHIIKYAVKFKEKLEQAGISPPEFRYKLWRLHSKLVREKCQETGITFIATPKESHDTEGFLSEKYLREDPWHANALYGDLVLNQIRAIHNMDTKQVPI
jgi:hypothetical protein